MLFHNMSSSETTGNSSVALTQCFTENSGLQPGIKKFRIPLSSHSDPGEGAFSRLDHGSLALRPVALLASCRADQLASSHRGRLHPASDGLVTRAVAGYHYSANWAICTGRLSPARHQLASLHIRAHNVLLSFITLMGCMQPILSAYCHPTLPGCILPPNARFQHRRNLETRFGDFA